MRVSFPIMRLLSTVLVVLASQVFAVPAVAQVANDSTLVRRDAREQAPDALLGIWKADIAASSYPGDPPREHLRVFQYTADGKVMVIFLTLAANGAQTAGHWAVKLDGTPGPEYLSRNGSTVFAEVALAAVDPFTFNVTEMYQGAVIASGVYTLTEDGQTLSLTRRAANGSEMVVVYRRWGA